MEVMAGADAEGKRDLGGTCTGLILPGPITSMLASCSTLARPGMEATG
jgi:hypothetical protein